MLPKMRSPLQYFLLLFIPLAVIVLAGSFSYWRLDARARLEVLQTREMARIVREVQIMEADFALRAADAAFLAERVTAELEHSIPPVLHVQDLLQSFAGIKCGFRCVRYLNAQGMEEVRLDISPQGVNVVPRVRLQDRSGRPGFRQAIGLPYGQVHASRMGLFVDQGRIVEPLMPVCTSQARCAGRMAKPPGLWC